MRPPIAWVTRVMVSMTVLTSSTLVVPVTLVGQDLLTLVREAEYKPPTWGEFQSACSESTLALEAAQTHLRHHDADGRWRPYLLLDDLAVSLNDLSAIPFLEARLDEPDAAIHVAGAMTSDPTAAIRATLKRTIGRHEGLETPAIMELRQSLQRLVEVIDALNHADRADEFAARQHNLLELLHAPESRRDLDWHRQVMPLVSWLDDIGQAEHVVAWARRYWSHPNFEAQISSRAMEIITRRWVEETEPISEYQDGRWITGRALVTGVAKMVPRNTQPAECQIVFDGNVDSRMGGSEGPVSFRLAGATQLRVEQSVRVSPDEFVLQPPLASASTRLWTDRVSTRRNGFGSRLIRGIATQMIARERPQAQRALNQNARKKFVKRFRENVAGEIGEAFRSLQTDLLAPLHRLDVHPDDLHFVSTDTRLQTRMTVNGGRGLGAPRPAPARTQTGANRSVGTPPADMAVSVHESVINRLAQRILAGKTYRDPAKLARQSCLELCDQQLEQIPSDVAMTFADFQPVFVRFEDNALELTLQGERYEVATAILVGMRAQIRYRIGVDRGDLVFKLDGVPRVSPMSGIGSGRFFIQKNVVEKRLAQDLPKETRLVGFDLPEPANRLGRARFRSATAHSGWLQIELAGEREAISDWKASR